MRRAATAPVSRTPSLAELLSMLGIAKSHSRPKASNDNPYSEAAFKTLKYCPVFPGRFGSFQDARRFCRSFFEYYNHEHYHSGIGLHMPFIVHIGTAHAIQHKRAEAIEAFRAANPQRFTRRPALPGLSEAAWMITAVVSCHAMPPGAVPVRNCGA